MKASQPSSLKYSSNNKFCFKFEKTDAEMLDCLNKVRTIKALKKYTFTIGLSTSKTKCNVARCSNCDITTERADLFSCDHNI